MRAERNRVVRLEGYDQLLRQREGGIAIRSQLVTPRR